MALFLVQFVLLFVHLMAVFVYVCVCAHRGTVLFIPELGQHVQKQTNYTHYDYSVHNCICVTDAGVQMDGFQQSCQKINLLTTVPDQCH